MDEAFPYISKLLMTDDSPRLRAALQVRARPSCCAPPARLHPRWLSAPSCWPLQYMVYGRNSEFDADRLIDLLDAFETFTVASQSARGNMDLGPEVEVLPPVRTSTMPDGSIEQPTSSGRLPSLAGGFGAGWPAPALLPALAAPMLAPSPLGASLTSLVPVSASPDSRAREALRCVCGGGGRSAAARWAAVSWPAHAACACACVHRPARAPLRARRFVLSPEGSFFREFLMDEAVKSVDALSREQLRWLLSQLGLQNVMLPVLIPGAARLFVPLAPPLSDEDRRVVENVSKVRGGRRPRVLRVRAAAHFLNCAWHSPELERVAPWPCRF